MQGLVHDKPLDLVTLEQTDLFQNSGAQSAHVYLARDRAGDMRVVFPYNISGLMAVSQSQTEHQFTITDGFDGE